MLLPLDSYELISTKPRSSTSDTTVLEFFGARRGFVKASSRGMAAIRRALSVSSVRSPTVLMWMRCSTRCRASSMMLPRRASQPSVCDPMRCGIRRSACPQAENDHLRGRDLMMHRQKTSKNIRCMWAGR